MLPQCGAATGADTGGWRCIGARAKACAFLCLLATLVCCARLLRPSACWPARLAARAGLRLLPTVSTPRTPS